MSFVVNVFANPKAGFEFSPFHPIEGMDEVLFTNTSSGQNLSNFSWHFNNNSGFTSSSEHTSYLFENEGIYPIAMVVSNANGCSDTLIKTITVEPNFNIYVPNAFTPNGDNLNDVFMPVGSGIKTYSLLIFDRWGGKLFESATILVGWDGTYKGEAVKMDIYNWKISATNAKGEKKEMAGRVSLLR
jgi:gliding motility-associated-like protein